MICHCVFFFFPLRRLTTLPSSFPPSSLVLRSPASTAKIPIFNYCPSPPSTLWPPPSLCLERHRKPTSTTNLGEESLRMRTGTSAEMMTRQPQSGLFHLSRILSHGMRAKGPRVRLTDYDSLIGRIPRPEDCPRRGHLGSTPPRQHNKGCRSISKAALRAGY